MWNMDWIMELPIVIKALILLTGFFLLACDYFVTKSEAQVKENDNHELLDEKSKR